MNKSIRYLLPVLLMGVFAAPQSEANRLKRFLGLEKKKEAPKKKEHPTISKNDLRLTVVTHVDGHKTWFEHSLGAKFNGEWITIGTYYQRQTRELTLKGFLQAKDSFLQYAKDEKQGIAFSVAPGVNKRHAAILYYTFEALDATLHDVRNIHTIEAHGIIRHTTHGARVGR